ncbi:class II glutamine amidotransferase [Candidatus Dojkabacteria bacterium]|jgi:hypothetical protein|nr:class II glutamine amidotransferase [Candidatus Dojkabacteria bacterium]
MQERGDHGTGIAGVLKDATDIVKQAVSAEEFVDSKGFKDLLRKNPRIILGHTRWATVGAISDKNAHPLNYSNIIGCHNGHVINYEDIFKENKVKGEVDSEAIFYLLNKYKNDYKKAFSELYGTFAITWINLKNPDKVYMVRDGNPLFIINIPELHTYFWASTDIALRIAIAPFYSLQNKKVWEIEPEKAYEISTNFQIKKVDISFKSYWQNSVTEKEKAEAKIAQIISDEIKKTEEKEEQKDIDEIVNGKHCALMIPTFFERTGYKNPFIKTTDELIKDEYYKLMDLTVPEMQNIITKVASDGCILCNKWIDFDKCGGAFWYKKEDSLLCLKCQIELKENRSELLWLTKKNIDDIYVEIEAYEEEMRDNVDERLIGG